MTDPTEKKNIYDKEIGAKQDRMTLARTLYKELKFAICFIILLELAVAFALYSSYQPNIENIFFLVVSSTLFCMIIWAMSVYDEMGAANSVGEYYEPLLMKFNNNVFFACFATPIAMLILLIYPQCSKLYNAFDLAARGTYYDDAKAGLPKSDKNRPDPCKIFDGLCNKDAITVASLIGQGFDIKAADLKQGEFILQKGTTSFMCQKLFASVGGYTLAGEAEIGSALCKQIRKGGPDDMDNYSDYVPFPN